MELFECITISLEEVAGETWSISESALFAAVQKSGFIVSLLVSEKLLSLPLPLSVFLQEKSLNRTKEVIQSLREIRQYADDFFGQILVSATKIAEDFSDGEIRAPRVVSRKKTELPREQRRVKRISESQYSYHASIHYLKT